MSNDEKPFAELLDDFHDAVVDYHDSETPYRLTRQKEKDELQDALIARHDRLRAINAELFEALKTLRRLVKEGGVPRYTVTPGAALNAVIEEVVDPAIRKAGA